MRRYCKTPALMGLGLTMALGGTSAFGQILTESMDSGLPAGPTYPNHAPPGAAIALPSGNWWAENLSNPIGVIGVFQGNTGVFLPQAGAGYAAINFNNGAG